jgi:hypothetical protein
MSIKRDDLDRIIHAGQMMSNICYNLGQESNGEGSWLSRDAKECMRKCQAQWDEVVSAVRQRQKASKPKAKR